MCLICCELQITSAAEMTLNHIINWITVNIFTIHVKYLLFHINENEFFVQVATQFIKGQSIMLPDRAWASSYTVQTQPWVTVQVSCNICEEVSVLSD
jgi:hypothetical protein